MANFAPGAYTVTYAGTLIGETEGPKRFQMTPLGEPVRADSFGRRIVDVVDQGQDWFIQMVLKEWNAAVEAALYPFGTTYGTPGTSGAPAAGRLYTGMASPLLLHPVQGTPAATQGPGEGATGFIQALLAIVVPDQQIEVLLGNVERNTPVTFLCLPDSAGIAITEETS